jgi:hypothetical protein
MAIRVFLSFVEEDLNLVNLFRGQAKCENSELEFHDYSIKVPYNSLNEAYIGRNIAVQIGLCTVTLCLYGPTTHSSHWVDWELRKSKELGKPVLGVCLYSDGSVQYYPAQLEGCPRMGWNIPIIMTSVNAAASRFRGTR